MAGSDLTVARVREALDYNADTGVFTWRIKTSRKIIPGQVAGCSSHGYTAIRLDGRMYLAHRLAWLHINGEWPQGWLDHINGDKADNRIANLRETDATENGLNCHAPRKHNANSPYIGVVKPKKYQRWQAKITIQGKRQLLGCYDTAEQARDAYLDAKKHLAPTAFGS